MNDREDLRKGLQSAAFGYFFLYFNLNIGRLNLLPAFVGYILFVEVIKVLQVEERELALLDSTGRILILWNLLLWILGWFRIDIEWQFTQLVFSILNLYFQFQLLTNIASIAGKYQGEENFEGRILTYRTLQTLILTFVTGITCFSFLLTEIWQYVTIGMAVLYLIIGLCIIKVLLDLRACLQ